ncbi:unnamed protein product, partial [marine sediment metagenome]
YNGDLPAEVPYFLLALASYNVGAYPIAESMARQCLIYADHVGAKKILQAINTRGEPKTYKHAATKCHGSDRS